MLYKIPWLLSLLFLLSTQTLASDGSATASRQHVWMIGGGNVIDNSQGQIELNVKWVQSIMQDLIKPKSLNVYYTDGSDPRPDVIYYQPPGPGAEQLTPLARVFGQYHANGQHYKNHDVPDVLASTTAQKLTTELTNGLLQMAPDDEALIIYNGHGSLKSKDIRNNALMLWDDTRLSVRDLDKILNILPPETPVRMVLTQCFSGAFANLIYRESTQKAGMSTYTRCGFFAESPFREAEGCAEGINVGDFRDYTTYFFAALQGKTRLGETITAPIDTNQDGKVSLREAHFYTLENAYSTDLSRSTSEVFLENWQPWYTKWHTDKQLPDNIYGRLAQRLAKKYDVADGSRIYAHRTDIEQTKHALADSLAERRRELSQLEQALKARVLAKWPALALPYTQDFYQLLSTQLATIQGFISADPEYDQLVAKQDDVDKMVLKSLALERRLTQLEKIKRMRKLARIVERFQVLGNDVRQREYQRLVACEEGVIQP